MTLRWERRFEVLVGSLFFIFVSSYFFLSSLNGLFRCRLFFSPSLSAKPSPDHFLFSSLHSFSLTLSLLLCFVLGAESATGPVNRSVRERAPQVQGGTCRTQGSIPRFGVFGFSCFTFWLFVFFPRYQIVLIFLFIILTLFLFLLFRLSGRESQALRWAEHCKGAKQEGRTGRKQMC